MSDPDQGTNDPALLRLARIRQIVNASYFEIAGAFTAAAVRDGMIPSLAAIQEMTTGPAAHVQLALAPLFPLTAGEVGFIVHEVLTNAFEAVAECTRRQIAGAETLARAVREIASRGH